MTKPTDRDHEDHAGSGAAAPARSTPTGVPAFITTTKVFTTAAVSRWWRGRGGAKPNHPLPSGLLEQLDPNGLHVTAQPSFLHEAGPLVTVRTILLLKLKARDEPHSVLVDIPLDAYNDAVDFEDLSRALELWQRHAHASG